MLVIANQIFLNMICSSVADNKNFHSAGVEYDQPYLYCTLTQPGDKVRIISQINNKKIFVFIM